MTGKEDGKEGQGPKKGGFLRRLGRWCWRGFLAVFVIVVLSAAYLAYDVWNFAHTPASPEPANVVIEIKPGATFDRVAWDLYKLGAIRDVRRFRLIAYWEEAMQSVKAGEFEVSTGWTPLEVLYQITKGRARLYRLAIREGLTWWETARAVEAAGFATYDDFKDVIHDPEFLKEFSIPFDNAEGFLFPETYLLKKPKALDKAQAREVASILVSAFWKHTRPMWRELPLRQGVTPPSAGQATQAGQAAHEGQPGQTGAEQTGTPQAAQARHAAQADSQAGTPDETPDGARANSQANSQAGSQADSPAELQTDWLRPSDIDPDALKSWVILSSLVEKETGVPEERARVAGVYANRLRLGMLLQCDPTIIYGVGESFSGSIRRSQLDNANNLYNTYQHPGLPPGPICSSGLAALKAAFSPEEHDYLYFVATGVDGGHTFSKTLNDHNRAVRAYRSRR